jgi:hypothetical protein
MTQKVELENATENAQAKRFKPDENNADKDVTDFLDWCKSMSMFIDFEKVYL